MPEHQSPESENEQSTQVDPDTELAKLLKSVPKRLELTEEDIAWLHAKPLGKEIH